MIRKREEKENAFSRLKQFIRTLPGGIWAFVIGVLLGVGVPALFSSLVKESKSQFPQSQFIIQGGFNDLAYDGSEVVSVG